MASFASPGNIDARATAITVLTFRLIGAAPCHGHSVTRTAVIMAATRLRAQELLQVHAE
jgi:hypothetical protein